ncbi:MAG: hypothetical protein NTW11_04080 [Candidatus Staskawiczbacteria bacterium]|nr:hypothetical protein [Candidatus Staskawiczbacteria bacterium]
MVNTNQRIIFVLPENIASAEIISDIFKKNGVTEDTFEEISDKKRLPKVVVVINGTKDFFDKKITEEKMSEIFLKELQVSKEGALGIINDIKIKLLPFAKKISIPADKEQPNVPTMSIVNSSEKVTDDLAFIQNDMLVEKKESSLKENIEAPINTKTKFKKITEIKEEPNQNIKQKRGPDSYREPIE